VGRAGERRAEVRGEEGGGGVKAGEWGGGGKRDMQTGVTNSKLEEDQVSVEFKKGRRQPIWMTAYSV